MKKYIIIKADGNDADYVYSKHEIDKETLKKIKPVIEAINNHTGFHNFETGECEGKDSASDLYSHIEGYDEFRDLCPYGEYGIHTIESIEVLTVSNEKRLL